MPEHDGERFLTCVVGLFHGEVLGPVYESTYVARRPVMRLFEVSAYGGSGWPPSLGVLEYETEVYRVLEMREPSANDCVRFLVVDGMSHVDAMTRCLRDVRKTRGGMVG